MGSDEPILYTFRRCPYAIRARMALNQATIKYQHREVVLKNKPQSMLKFSPKATVPVLIVNGNVIDESLAIMHWALQQRDEDNWLKAKDQHELITICDKQFKPQLGKYKYFDLYEKTQEHYRQQTTWFLSLLDSLIDGKTHLFSNDVSLADVAIFPFVRQFAFVDKNWFDKSSYGNLKKWLDTHLNSILFLNCMKKYKPWMD
jgi:glutathione S-transferase